MRHFLKIAFLSVHTLCAYSLSAQCTLSWEESTFTKPIGKGTVTREKLTDDGYIVGFDGYKISKPFLDSAIQYFKKPHWYLDRFGLPTDVGDSTVKALTDSMKIWGDYREFAIFKLRGKEIVHYSTDTFTVDEETIYVHRFEYCEDKWNEDFLRKDFRYTRQFGIIEKGQCGGMGDIDNWHTYILNNSSCLGKEGNEKMKKLVSKIWSK